MKEQFLEKNHALQKLHEYERNMKLQELSDRTINKYMADIKQWLQMEEGIITKKNIITWFYVKSIFYYNRVNDLRN